MVSQHVSLEELQAFVLDKEPLSPAAWQHLDSCPTCQEQMANSRQITTYLLAQLYRRQCPSAATLSYYCLPGTLTEEEYSQVSDHLARCPRCLAEFTDSRRFLNTLE
ncbi:MAG TPA: hypothetical protein VGD98_16420 [Ktedonobacteraceae bacterium]